MRLEEKFTCRLLEVDAEFPCSQSKVANKTYGIENKYQLLIRSKAFPGCRLEGLFPLALTRGNN